MKRAIFFCLLLFTGVQFHAQSTGFIAVRPPEPKTAFAASPTAADRDADGIDDQVEALLLQRFRPTPTNTG